jgi:rhodanese-related sulfurtransferase/predicted metal-dependent enzyme (double-stranded beta helix superfamily)
MLSVMERRHAAVAETIARIRAVEHDTGITGAALDDIKSLVTDLACRTELFPPEHFAVPDGKQTRLYRLAEDPDHRFALYASAGTPGKAQPPHNHTTWAVIAGVYGQEHNVFYERTDNRSTPGQGTLRRTGELTVVKGNAVAFMPDDFHTIEVVGSEPSLHLHMYGLSLEHLPERINFASASGGPYTIFPANPGISAPEVPPGELKAMLRDGEELAILDVREEGIFAQGHLLLAASLPLSRLEVRLAALVPRRGARIVVCDEHGVDGGLAQKAAYRLLDFGYGNVAVLKGGVAGWRAAGYELFSGVFVPSKAFGEFVEHRCDTPRLDAADLKAKLDAGEDVLILDSRPMSEYRVMSIPGGIDCPGAELVYRVHDLVKSPDTLVVVNCAGRTRSIIGAQSLINAGLPNRVVALKNGTMGWHLAGFPLEHGQRRHAPDPSPEGLARARQAAARVAERFGVRRIDRGALRRFEAERETRSLYLLDVRSPEEYAAGHLPGSRSAPGGQLVQATDVYVGTRNARLVLVDGGDGVRATMTASWVVQMGWDEVYVLADALLGEPLEIGPERVPVFGLPPLRGVSTLSPADLDGMLKEGRAVVVDLANSLDYREGHIPGAWFAVRSRFPDGVARLPGDGALVLTSPDGVLARVAAADLAAAAPARPVHVLDGGTAAWRAAGLPLTAGEENLADTPDDVWYRPYDRGDGVEAAMQEYLRWELDLVTQIDRDGDARFRIVR